MNSKFGLTVVSMLFFLATLAACGGGGGRGGSAAAPTYTIGGSVSGVTGSGLVLRNNGGDSLAISGSGAFTFSASAANGAGYSVTVQTQPANPGQTCSVTNGTGTVSGANVTGVVVNCVTHTYTVGGAITGLGAGKSVVLQNNGGNDLTVSANGSFTFTTPVADGAVYAVMVLTQPVLQACTVASANGTVSGANVTNVSVTCVASIALPKTGQTTCYDATPAVVVCAGTGQDGELQKGATASPRFTVDGSGNCVTDNLTGLMWVQAPSLTGGDWASALTAANGLNLCSFTDWRLPNLVELGSLLNYSVADNAAVMNAAGFSNIGNWYWTSTSMAGYPLWVGVLNITDGQMTTSAAKTYTYPRTLPVRGP